MLEKNGKLLGALMLNIWMKNEPSSCALLTSMLREANVSILNESNSSSSTIGVTTNKDTARQHNTTSNESRLPIEQI